MEAHVSVIAALAVLVLGPVLAGLAADTPHAPLTGKASIGLKPLCDMNADDKYKGEDGGLYGGGKNQPPEALRFAAEKELAQIQALDADGKPSPTGRVVLVSMGMSNTTAEFAVFKQAVDLYSGKSPQLTIVDCAQSSMTAHEWAGGTPPPWVKEAPPWPTAEQRLKAAGVTPAQVQVAWVKMANRFPKGDMSSSARELQADIAKSLQLARQHFPNLRIAYLSSRIYGGYATMPLNPEPYAYEGAFAVRWLILDQMAGTPELNFDPANGKVQAPLLLWGPYLWADGATPRKLDGLVWERKDLADGDGTHPSRTSGCQKVSDLLLKFFSTDVNAKSWFLGKDK